MTTLRRAALLPILVLLGGTLASCASPDPGAPPPSAIPSATASATPTAAASPSTVPGDDMRAQLAAGLRSVSPASSRLVEKPATKLHVVPAAWLPGWRVIDVTNNTLAHPQRFYVALAEGGEVQYLTGEPESFAAMVTAAKPEVASAKTARAVSDLYLDSTRAFETYSYRIANLDDVMWLPHPTAADTAARARVEKTYTDRVTGPAPRRSGSGWQLTQWMVAGRELVRHEVTVSTTGEVTDRADTVVSLPVPTSV